MNQAMRVWHDVYIIGGSEISHPYDCCVYLIDAGELILIDTGAGQSFNRLVDNIHAFGLAPERLNSIIVTHRHIDHIGALAEFKNKYGVKVIAHELDAPAIESGNGTGADAYGVDYQPCPVDVKIEGAEHNLHYGRHDLKLIHIPGHTPGSIAVYVEITGKRVLFGQDIHGPYESEWGGDPKQAITSLEKLVDLKADMLCEGHFGIYQPGDRVKRYIESYIYNLEQQTAKKH
jgi:glyoxylase-like metal-dependent hydrolase (beta-lactamase superfamily II)